MPRSSCPRTLVLTATTALLAGVLAVVPGVASAGDGAGPAPASTSSAPATTTPEVGPVTGTAGPAVPGTTVPGTPAPGTPAPGAPAPGTAAPATSATTTSSPASGAEAPASDTAPATGGAGATAEPSGEAPVVPGDTVTGEVLRVYADPAPATPGEREHEGEHEHHADVVLTYVQTDDGGAVRVLTEDLATVARGSTVQVTVGEQVPDAAAADGHVPAVDVLATDVLSTPTVERLTTAQASGPVNHAVTVVMMQPAGAARDSTSLAQVTAAVNGPVADFWDQQTGGVVRLGVTGQVDWFQGTTTCSNPVALWDEAAQRAGWTYAPGRHLLVYLPMGAANCSYGLGEVRQNTSSGGRAYVTAAATSVIAHELGHNFGLNHSSELQCDRTLEGSATSACQVSPYDDYYDVMGVSWQQLGTLSALQQAQLGVLPAGQRTELTAASPRADHRLAPVSSPIGTKALKLTAASGAVYWLEYRPASGRDSWLATTGAQVGLQAGVLVRRVNTGPNSSLLLDGSPSAPGGWANDMASVLPVGTRVELGDGSLVVTVRSTDGNAAVVTVGLHPIELAYEQTGEAGGPLGAALGPYFCVLRSGGCYQEYRNGAMYWTPATGAHYVTGAMRARWDAQGRENGGLGFPTSDPTCGLRDAGCYQQFQGGALYSSNATPVQLVFGGVRSTWSATGAENGPLGYPTTDEQGGLVRGGTYQQFQNGAVYWSPASGAHVVSGAIRDRWRQLNAEFGGIGYPTTDPFCGLKDGGCYQQFQGGAMYTSAGTPVHVVFGGIRTAWNATGSENGPLGYPTSDETAGQVRGGTFQSFQNGAVYWSPATGARVVTGQIRDRWTAVGGPASGLGYPGTDTFCGLKDSGCYQQFEGGALYVSASTPVQAVFGGIRAAWNARGAENGPLGFPTSDEQIGLAGGAHVQTFQGGSIIWSPALGVRVMPAALWELWHAMGTSSGGLGNTVGDTVCGLRGGGCYQPLQRGAMYVSPGTPATVVYGAIRATYSLWGAENADLGYPAGNEQPAAGGGSSQQFQGGTVYWSSATGAQIVWNGSIRDLYLATGAERSILGYPTGATYCVYVEAGCGQSFQGGAIYSSYWTQAAVIPAAVRRVWVANGSERGPLGYPTQSAVARDGGWEQPFQGGVVVVGADGASTVTMNP